MADNRTLKIIVDAENKAAGVLNQVTGSLEKVQSKLAPAAEASRKVGIAFGAVAASIGGLGVAALKATADIETQRIGFTTLLGSAEKADEAIKMIQRDAASTPFEFKGLVEANKALTLVTKNSVQSESVLLNVGKALAAAGKGQPELDRIVANLQQIGNVGKISEMDIRQFGFNGVNILELLADYYGTTKEAAGEMVKNSKDAFADLSAAFEKAGSDGGQFANTFTDAGGSLNQMISNVADAWNIFLQNQGAKLIDWGKKFVALLIDIINNQLPAWITKIEEVVDWFSKNQGALIVLAGIITGLFVPAILSAAIAFGTAAIALAPFVLGGALIGGVIAGILWIVQNWDMISAKAVQIWDGIKNYFAGVWANITGTIQSAWNKVAEFFGSIWQGILDTFTFYVDFIIGLVLVIFGAMGIDLVAIFQNIATFFSEFWNGTTDEFNSALETIQQLWSSAWTWIDSVLSPFIAGIQAKISGALAWFVAKLKEWTAPISDAWRGLWSGLTQAAETAWEGAKNVVKDSINWIIDKVNFVINSINEIAQKGASVFGKTAPQIATIPKLAEGGIVTRPTLALIGEAGPEAVVPLNKAGAGVGMTIIFQDNQFIGEEGIAERLMKQIMDGIRQQIPV